MLGEIISHIVCNNCHDGKVLSLLPDVTLNFALDTFPHIHEALL